MSISVEAVAAHDSLSDDKELIHTYEVFCFFISFMIRILSEAIVLCIARIGPYYGSILSFQSPSSRSEPFNMIII